MSPGFRKWSRRVFFAVLAIPVLFFLYIGMVETIFYLRRSPERAEQAAQRVFLEVCAREHLDPKSFSGPSRPELKLDQQRNQYTFVWSETPEKTIYVHVSYLPYDLVYSMSVPLVEEKRR
jgi:hypothetical protein